PKEEKKTSAKAIKMNTATVEQTEKNLYPHSFRFSKATSQDVRVFSLLTKKSQNQLMREAFELWKEKQNFSKEEYKTALRYV
ncbi:MAG: hypothetical protein V1833_07640, partial [Elusimicrobiota bacterium]